MKKYVWLVIIMMFLLSGCENKRVQEQLASSDTLVDIEGYKEINDFEDIYELSDELKKLPKVEFVRVCNLIVKEDVRSRLAIVTALPDRINEFSNSEATIVLLNESYCEVFRGTFAEVLSRELSSGISFTEEQEKELEKYYKKVKTYYSVPSNQEEIGYQYLEENLKGLLDRIQEEREDEEGK